MRVESIIFYAGASFCVLVILFMGAQVLKSDRRIEHESNERIRLINERNRLLEKNIRVSNNFDKFNRGEYSRSLRSRGKSLNSTMKMINKVPSQRRLSNGNSPLKLGKSFKYNNKRTTGTDTNQNALNSQKWVTINGRINK